MSKSVPAFLAIVVLTLPISSIAQEKDIKASFEDFQEWGNRLEGRWVGEIKLVADWPGLGRKAGDEIIEHVTYRWFADKHAIEETRYGGDGESKVIHYWDAGTKQIKLLCVTSGGDHWTACIGRDGDKWPWTVKGTHKDGTKMTGSGVDVLKKDGKFTVDGDCALDGKKLPHFRDVYQKVSK